jgi:hypothetical protein
MLYKADQDLNIMTKNNILPFGWAPAHWGLKGKLRDLAKAEYELSGEELARRKLEINLSDRPENEIKIESLKLDHKYGELNDIDLEREIATVNDEPWVTIKTLETDPDNPRFGGVELDWNQAFIDNLEKHDYGPHPQDDDTVNEWFNDLCRNIALDAFDGVGDLQERIESEINPRTGMHEDAIFTPRPKTDDV